MSQKLGYNLYGAGVYSKQWSCHYTSGYPAGALDNARENKYWYLSL